MACALSIAGCLCLLGCGDSEDAANAAKLDGTNADHSEIIDESGDEPAPRPPFDLAELPREHGVTIEDGDVAIRLDDATVTRGGQGQAIVDQETGRYLWAALTCENCPNRTGSSQPSIFVYPVPIKGIDSAGYVKLRNGVTVERLTPKCPVCRQSDGVRPYMLPESAQQQDNLDDELAAARAAFRATGALPTDMRPPSDIFRDRSQLRRLYLPAKYSKGVR